jgi:hypothetical protein
MHTQYLDMAHVDPILAAACKNKTESLVQLPDCIIINIMKQLDLKDLVTVWHVSRDFLRLFNYPEFRRYHLREIPGKEYMELWAEPVISPNWHTKADQDDSICTRCQREKTGKDLEDNGQDRSGISDIFCAGCKKRHRASCFSHQQRNESNNYERRCKGLERSIRLCQHVSLSWEKVKHLSSQPEGKNWVICQHKDHRNTLCRHVRRNIHM